LLPKLAVYISNHGFGHTVRTAELLSRLLELGPFEVHLLASSPSAYWPAVLAPVTLSRRQQPSDPTVVEDGLCVDHGATQQAHEVWREGYRQKVTDEARWLRDNADLVLGDVPPLAFAAAAEAGLPSVALANFSWDWIYQEMGLGEAAQMARSAYEKAGVLLALEPGCPMPAFKQTHAIGMLGRRGPGVPTTLRRRVRRRLGLKGTDRLVVVALRDSRRRLRSDEPALVRLPEPTPGLVYAVLGMDGPGRTDVVQVPAAVTFMELLAAADGVVAKPGYGIITDTVANGIPFLWVRRQGFPEDRYLEAWLQGRSGTSPVSPQTLSCGAWLENLEELLGRPRPTVSAAPAARAGASYLAGLLGIGSS
jgi:L-arabinokinase